MAGFAKIRQSFCASLVFVTALFFFKVENLERIMLWSFLIRAEGLILRRLRHNIGRGYKARLRCLRKVRSVCSMDVEITRMEWNAFCAWNAQKKLSETRHVIFYKSAVFCQYFLPQFSKFHSSEYSFVS